MEADATEVEKLCRWKYGKCSDDVGENESTFSSVPSHRFIGTAQCPPTSLHMYFGVVNMKFLCLLCEILCPEGSYLSHGHWLVWCTMKEKALSSQNKCHHSMQLTLLQRMRLSYLSKQTEFGVWLCTHTVFILDNWEKWYVCNRITTTQEFNCDKISKENSIESSNKTRPRFIFDVLYKMSSSSSNETKKPKVFLFHYPLLKIICFPAVCKYNPRQCAAKHKQSRKISLVYWGPTPALHKYNMSKAASFKLQWENNKWAKEYANVNVGCIR